MHRLCTRCCRRNRALPGTRRKHPSSHCRIRLANTDRPHYRRPRRHTCRRRCRTDRRRNPPCYSCCCRRLQCMHRSCTRCCRRNRALPDTRRKHPSSRCRLRPVDTGHPRCRIRPRHTCPRRCRTDRRRKTLCCSCCCRRLQCMHRLCIRCCRRNRALPDTRRKHPSSRCRIRPVDTDHPRCRIGRRSTCPHRCRTHRRRNPPCYSC